MSTTTTNLGLKKPAANDFYNIQDFNDNADIIDEAIATMFDNLLTDETMELATSLGIEMSGVLILNGLVQRLLAHAPIETGTEGIWTYKKYADGTAECWGTITETFEATRAGVGGYYHPTGRFYDFPTGLFQKTPTAIGSAKGYVFATEAQVRASDATKLYWNVLSATNTSQAYAINVLVKGRWK